MNRDAGESAEDGQRGSCLGRPGLPGLVAGQNIERYGRAGQQAEQETSGNQ